MIQAAVYVLLFALGIAGGFFLHRLAFSDGWKARDSAGVLANEATVAIDESDYTRQKPFILDGEELSERKK